MNDSRFLFADIDPSQDANVNTLKERALELIHQTFTEDKELHDDAAVAVLNDYDDMQADNFLKQLRTCSMILLAVTSSSSFTNRRRPAE